MSVDEITPRPTEAEIKEMADNYLRRMDNPGDFFDNMHSLMADLAEIAKTGKLGGVEVAESRVAQHYPGWTLDDYRDLYNRINPKYEFLRKHDLKRPQLAEDLRRLADALDGKRVMDFGEAELRNFLGVAGTISSIRDQILGNNPDSAR